MASSRHSDIRQTETVHLIYVGLHTRMITTKQGSMYNVQ